MAELRRRHELQLTARGRHVLVVAGLCSQVVVQAAQRDSGPAIVVNPGRYVPYYHMRFDMTAAAIDFSRTDRRAGPGGQFTIRLRPARFPIAAPSCRGDLIVRMPWTSPSLPEAESKIAAKTALLDRILALEHAADGVVPVVLELNPYVQVMSRSPMTLRLTECNVFFRQVLGAYVSDTEPRPAR